MDEVNDVGGESPALNPRVILDKIGLFTEEVTKTFQDLMGSLDRLQNDIKQLDQLKGLVNVTEKMLSGQHKTHVDLEAKGEMGRLVTAINKTLDNLRQLDKTVHLETGKVPELAAHLDHITVETETATQQVLEKLDQVIESSETQNNSLQLLRNMSRQRLDLDRETLANLDALLENLSKGENQESVLQEALDFVALMGEQARAHLDKSQEVDKAIEHASEQAENLMNHAFDIMNLLQFQDITRQKVSKVIALLKEMQTGLYRLLEIFNIQTLKGNRLELTEKQKATQEHILERNAIKKDTHLQDVDAIIESFRKQ